MLIATLFVNKNRLILIQNQWGIHIMQYSTARKINEPQLCILTWMAFTSMKMRTRSRSQNNTFITIPLKFAHVFYIFFRVSQLNLLKSFICGNELEVSH